MPQDNLRKYRLHICRLAHGRAVLALSSVIVALLVSMLRTAVASGASRGVTPGKALSLSSPMTASVRLLQKDVEARIKALEGNDALDKELKKKLLTLYQQAQSYLVAADSYEQTGAAYEQSLKAIPAEIAELGKKVGEAQAALDSVPVEDVSRVPLTELDFRLTVAGAELDALRGDIDAMENMLQEQKGRPAQIREELKAD